MKMTKDQMGKWFGREAFSSQASRKEILRVMNSVDHMISNVEPVYEGPQCSSNTYAYVYPTAYTCSYGSELKSRACTKYNGKFVFYLCSLYFRRESEMIETLVHEGSHHATSYTDDVDFNGGTAYGRSTCTSLARVSPSKALKNADNYCYYIEDVATQQGGSTSGGRSSGGSSSSGTSYGATRCHSSARKTYADSDGDCQCPSGTKCLNSRTASYGCSYSGGSHSYSFFSASCSYCYCRRSR